MQIVPPASEKRGFTLVEMLTVLAIIGVLLLAIVPAITSMSNNQALGKASGDIANTLEQARAYAMANNTYVYVGFYEADAASSESTRPQTSGTGRVWVGVVATKDGTTGYSNGTAWPAPTSNTNIGDITKPQRFDGIHLVDPTTASSLATTLPNMDYTTGGTNGTAASLWIIGGTSTDSYDVPATGVPFNAPAASSTQKICQFSQVVQFTPSGSANLVTATGGTYTQMLLPYIQIGLMPTHGNQAVSNSPNCAGIQVDGLTGVVRLYRP